MENRRLGILAACIIVIGASIMLIAFTVAKVLGSGDGADLKSLESDYQTNTRQSNQTIQELNSRIAALTRKLESIEKRMDQHDQLYLNTSAIEDKLKNTQKYNQSIKELNSSLTSLNRNLEKMEERMDVGQQNSSEFLHQLSLNVSTSEAKMEAKLIAIWYGLQAMIKAQANAQKLVNAGLHNEILHLNLRMISNFVRGHDRTTPDEPQQVWNISYACQVFKDPELTDLRSEIPGKISVIFSNDTKAIETATWRRQLTIDNNQKLATTRVNSTGGLKYWQFQAVEDTCEYFLIVHVGLNVALGVVNHTQTPPSDHAQKVDHQPLDEIRGDSRYHWKILLKDHPYRRTFYRFINRDTGVALAANDDNDVLPHSANGCECEDWELK